MSRNVQTVILCEDRQQEVFVRRFLEQEGKGFRVQRIEFVRNGYGSGEQFVRERFAKELAFYRSRQHRVGQALIVVIDADGRKVKERIRQLDAAAAEGGQERRRADERVAIFVLAWNIETWLAYLSGSDVDESKKNYPRLSRQRECQPLVERLHEMCQQGALRQPLPPSLEAACVEYCSRLQS